MNRDELVNGIIAQLTAAQLEAQQLKVIFDYWRLCRDYESDFKSLLNFSEAAKTLNEYAVDAATRAEDFDALERLLSIKLHMMRMDYTWAAVCAIFDADTPEAANLAHLQLAAAGCIPVPEYHVKFGLRALPTPETGIADLLLPVWEIGHPVAQTREYKRFWRAIYGNLINPD